MPVKEKVKLIAAQQDEINKREETETSGVEKKHKGVRILPPSPVTVRKMSVEEELYKYDDVVTRSTPVTQVLEQMENKPEFPQQDIFTTSKKSKVMAEHDYSTIDSGISQSYSNFESRAEYEETKICQ